MHKIRAEGRFIRYHQCHLLMLEVSHIFGLSKIAHSDHRRIPPNLFVSNIMALKELDCTFLLLLLLLQYG